MINMKSTKLVYWISTSLVVLMMTYSGVLYLTDPALDAAFLHLGFPDYFRVELAVAKFLGAAILILPVYSWIKEWAYAGFTIVFISAMLAHGVSGDPGIAVTMPAVFLALHLTSYFSYRALSRRKNVRLQTGNDDKGAMIAATESVLVN